MRSHDMRLRQDEVDAIKAVTRLTFGTDAIVRLFGSRVRDDLKGGDIDLHLEVADGLQDYRHASVFRERLFARIDEQKVDLVFRVRDRPLRAIDEIAYSEGIVL